MEAQRTQKAHLTVKELAEYLNCCLMTAYRLTHKEGFPVVRLGRKILVPIDGLNKWLAEHSEGGFDE